MKLAIVTATLKHPRVTDCITGWWTRATKDVSTYIVGQGGFSGGWDDGEIQLYSSKEILGVVPAFAIGAQKALEDGADIICCLHDDVEIHQDGWDETILSFFAEHPRCGLLGFGGGRGLGDPNLYNKPYDPMQLARRDFVSNMVDAEAHGRRVMVPTRVAALDGFSQVGRREFWEGWRCLSGAANPERNTSYLSGFRAAGTTTNLFQVMQSWGVIHHFYDGMLGCFAKRLGWEVWMLPVRCRHLGGQTAVGDPRYAQWANARYPEHIHTGALSGDALLWHHAHQVGYQQFKDVLPILIEEVESHATRNPV